MGNIPEDVVADMAEIAPMLRTLGYDPAANPPNYGKPDPQVADNTLHIRANADFWKQKENMIFDQLGGRPQDIQAVKDTGVAREGSTRGGGGQEPGPR